MAAVLDDPLRAARRAVQGGRFRDAETALGEVPLPVQEGPEWHLLSAMAAWRLGDFTRSRTAAREARNAYRHRGDADGEMRAENVAAAGAFALGDLDEAERGFTRAMLLARRLQDELMTARCANNIGNVAYYLTRHDVALSFYRLAEAAFARIDYLVGVAETRINLSIVLREQHRPTEALEAAERALDAAERGGSDRLSAQALVNCGAAAMALGDPALGRAQAEHGLSLARASEDPLGEAEGERVLAGVAWMGGQVHEAERRLHDALALATQLGHPWAIGEIQLDLGELLVGLGRFGEASQAFEEARRAFLRVGSLPRADAAREAAHAANIKRG
jgi:tetratricopeptide (TPR) repeat protein